MQRTRSTPQSLMFSVLTFLVVPCQAELPQNDLPQINQDQLKIQHLEQQVQDMQAEIQALAAAQPTESPKLAALEKINLWGYGEIYATRPHHSGQKAEADLARAVFGIGYEFDALTRFNSEFETEHAVTSAVDRGEFEVEQFYVDHDLGSRVGLTSGLFLIPAGFLNEAHEPTQFYGVERNFVESLIIPSTWREGGLDLHGDTRFGLHWATGLCTDQDLSQWNFRPTQAIFSNALNLENNAIAPLQSTHQELQLANAQHLAQFIALNYHGIPGLTLAGSLFSGLASTSANPGGNQRISLWEIHSRFISGPLDVTALYAHGGISQTAGANAANPAASHPMPAAFYGHYVQVAYTVLEWGHSHLNPFVRSERFNMASQYSSGVSPAAPAQAVWPAFADTVYTEGLNYYLNPQVVFKVDVQQYKNNRSFNRIDTGMGLAF